MRTVRSLTVSRRIPRTPPRHHAPPTTTHGPPQPCMPPSPLQPCMPPTTTYAPLQPRTPHHPPPTTHAPQEAHTHTPGKHAPPHAPSPWTEWQTGEKILPCPKLRLRAVIKKNLAFYGFGPSKQLSGPIHIGRKRWKVLLFCANLESVCVVSYYPLSVNAIRRGLAL